MDFDEIKTWEKFIKEITEEEFIQIVRDHQELYYNGSIGECVLRTKANMWCANSALPLSSSILYMKEIAQEAYQYFTIKYFEYKGII